MSDGAAISLSLSPEVLGQLVEAVIARIELQTVENVEPWLDVEAAATYLACSRKRIYDLVSLGRLRCARDGRRLLFRREWLDTVLDSRIDD